LQKYHWPGNIRELENIIERAINMCDGNEITIEDMPMYISKLKSTKANLINTINGEVMPFEEYEKEIIELAMKKYGSYNKAGKALGMTHRTISLKCKKYGVDKE
jgi:transcriptional regulator with PAS, ATPase and Fis domain